MGGPRPTSGTSGMLEASSGVMITYLKPGPAGFYSRPEAFADDALDLSGSY
jgi:hypothetical protein